MKKLYILLCVMISFNLQSEIISQFLSEVVPEAVPETTPHLILNFDVNKTLIASDKTENKSLHDVINEMLSRKYFACWDETLSESISFDAYVRTVILPGEEHDVKLKMERLVHLTHFIDYLREHNHPLYSIVLKEFNTIIETLQGAHIFPSFYRLIADLDQKGISYTLFLRSYGKEVFEVKNEINTNLNQLFQVDGVFRKGILYVSGQEPLETPEAIYAFFCSKNHGAIHDDWSHWMQGEMYAKYGKPLYIDLEDENTLTLFFDDNIKADSFEKNIIAPINSATGDGLSISSLLDSKQMISVDTLEAILNENYFIEKVQEAILEHQNGWRERKEQIGF